MRAEVKLPDEFQAPCPTHGVETFRWSEKGQVWACLGIAKQIRDRVLVFNRTYCSSIVLKEHYTPDGFDVEQADKLKWGQVTFNSTDRYARAWDEYLGWCGVG